MTTTKHKNTLLILIAAAAAITLVACEAPNELPEKGYGYPRSFILPSPVELTATERNYLNQLREEYETNKDL